MFMGDDGIPCEGSCRQHKLHEDFLQLPLTATCHHLQKHCLRCYTQLSVVAGLLLLTLTKHDLSVP